MLTVAGLMLLNLVWFLWVVRSFEYKAVEHPSMRPAPAQKPQGTLPPWVQPQIVSGVQQANVRCAKLPCVNACLHSCTSLQCVKDVWLAIGCFWGYGSACCAVCHGIPAFDWCMLSSSLHNAADLTLTCAPD